MNFDDMTKAVQNKAPESGQELIGDWENIVLLLTPGGPMIFESEADVDKFLKDNPGFFPKEIPFLPMKKGRVYRKDGQAYADFEEFTLHF